jgi:RND family efflux transporter MFP subunit
MLILFESLKITKILILKTDMKKMKKPYLIIAALILIAGGYYWYKKTHPAVTAVQYVTTTAEKGTLVSSISGSGNVIVDQASNIDPTITGTVSNLSVNVGDFVKQGQTLFTIVNDQLGVSVSQANTSLEQAESSLESARAQRKQASADYGSAKNSKSSTERERSALKAKLDAADESIDASEKNVLSSRTNLNYQLSQASKRNVKAPLSGTVNAINIKNGDDLSKLSSGSSRLVPIIIGDLETLKAQVEVNEVDISGVVLDQKAVLTFSAIDGFTSTGKIEKIDSLGTLTSGVVTYNVTVGFDSLDPRIRPGMSVSAAITTSVKQNVITVPSSAVKTQGNASYVEMLSGPTPQRANVDVGVSNNTDTEIISGVNVGDKVVTQTINSTSSSASSSASQSSTGRSSGGLRIPGLGGGGGHPD